MPTASPSDPKRHQSELPDPRQRFLSRVVQHALADSWRTATDFLRHFPPSAIMEALAGADHLRVRLLVATTGTHEKIALKKSIPSATEDLDIALSERTTTPEALLDLLPADDKVRYFDARKLWRFFVEDEFYKVTPSEDAGRHARAAERLTYIVECAIDEGLVTLKDVADGISFDEIASALPVHDVRELVKHALQIGRSGAPLTEERFLAIVPLSSLVSRVRLEHSWNRVIIERIAAPAEFVDARSVPPPPPSSVPVSVQVDEPELPPDVTMPADEVAIASAALPSGTNETSGLLDDDDIRAKLIDRLRLIDRLPPSYPDIGTPVLLSIESMYAELWTLTDDEEREGCIRESFPNETHLRSAMLSLIELLDPSVDTHDPIIRDADVSGLIKIVLFEERRRRDAGPSPKRGSLSTAPGSAKSRRSVPPPLPRSSTPPPLPGEGLRSSPPPLPAEAGKRDR